MTTDHGQILIGLGCSSKATADEIIALVQSCLAEAGSRADAVMAVVSHSRKTGNLALAQTAEHFGVSLFFLDDHVLAPEIASTCEAVAAVAGPLRLPKRKARFSTCAIAECHPGFSLDRLAQLASPSATIAASTLVTSWAGP
ncbi:cobalamin biosynthesis protein [Devosia submarina]|uniref:cobalamin biosynthesis protein n=1 Tax=Devosia submarina TaxID=1173082 RepID=UPI000D385837